MKKEVKSQKSEVTRNDRGTKSHLTWSIVIRRVAAISIALVAFSSPTIAWWFTDSGPCCEEAGWYVIDGGPLSWLCADESLDMKSLSAYLGQGDYEAARKVATRLMSSAERRCIFVPNASLELYVYKRDGQQ